MRRSVPISNVERPESSAKVQIERVGLPLVNLPHLAPVKSRFTGTEVIFVIDIKELSAQNRALRVRRLEQLKKSVESRRYHVSPVQIAGGIIREARIDAASRQADR